MSNVLKRFRTESSFQPLTDSRKLRSECLNWLFNEKNCPKKKRNLFTDKMAHYCEMIFDNIRFAQYCFPTNEEKLKQRKSYIKNAINGCIGLFQHFQYIDDVLKNSNGIDLDRLEPILIDIENLTKSLQTWLKNNKLSK